jgi:hypothetical protein
MEVSPPWETACRSATQESLNTFQNPEVHCYAHRSPPSVHSLSQINSVHTIQSYLRSILVISPLAHVAVPSGLFYSVIFHQNRILIPLLPIHAACPAHLILLDLIFVIVLSEEWKLWSSSLCNFLQPPIISYLFSPYILKHPHCMFS